MTADEKIIDFFKHYPEINYAKGDKILRPNEFFNHIYIIKTGYVRIYKLLKNGQEVTFNSYNPKKQKFFIFGYTTLLDGCYVEAFTDVVLGRAPKSEFQEFTDENPTLKDRIIQDWQTYFEELLQQVIWLSIPDAYTRIKVMLHWLAGRIGYCSDNKLLLENKSNLGPKVTHNLFASYTGLTRETVSIQINRLITEGYLSRQDNTLVIEKIDSLVEDIY